MAARAAILGVHLMDAARRTTRVGALTRDAQGATAFVADETYLRDDQRPILTLAWQVPGDPAGTRARIASRDHKIALYGHLPPWFQGLLPEGALRDLVDAEMGPGGHDHFDVLLRLGADLPGGVLIVPDTGDAPDSAGPLRWDLVAGFRAPVPQGAVKFSLAGVQLKFTVAAQGERLTVPARSGEGRLILKMASDRYPGLPEAEFTAMTLARAIGVQTAQCRLTPTDAIEGVPDEFIGGPTALAVERFDRTADGGRVHIEDAAQILSVWGERKYTEANTETVLNMIRRFSTRPRDDVMEAFRRIVADVLLGNGDNHLKNWSFIFPAPGVVRLSPAYDIVPTVLFQPLDRMALPFAGRNKAFEAVGLSRFRRAANFLGIRPEVVEREAANTVRAALSLWPELMRSMPIRDAQRNYLMDRLHGLRLVQEALAVA
jgi:serine/threonine-protein kinase HipA